MTVQVPEMFYDEGFELYSDDHPLSDVLKASGAQPLSISNTANRCGYVARWMVMDSYLYLVGIDAKFLIPKRSCEFSETLKSVNLIREGKCNKLRADWFSGNIDAFNKSPGLLRNDERLPEYWLQLRVRKGFVMQKRFKDVTSGSAEDRELCKKALFKQAYDIGIPDWLKP